jgi:Iron-containing redox enzyme
MTSAVTASPLPEFPDSVPHRASACTPRELYVALFVDPEDSVHFLEPAFRFVSHALEQAQRWQAGELGVDALPITVTPPAGLPLHDPGALVDALVAWARTALPTRPEPPAPEPPFASSWPVRVCREFAPVGLADGAWLRGSVLANRVETPLGMASLRQLMLRFGDPSSREAYSLRYASLLRSLGVPPESITRWDFEDSAPCTELSFEHALLGLSLGFFASSFGPEIVGFNLWMVAVGPCPLIETLLPRLRSRQACLRYFDQLERATLLPLARRAFTDLEADFPGIDDEARIALRQRIARGFFAAHRSYRRWHLAMLGRNVPLYPRDFVLEGVQRKARFAAEHHRDVRLAKLDVQALFLQGRDGHERLLDRLANSPLISPGSPSTSRFLTHTLSIHGPMFDSFTAAEKVDLAEWIAALPANKAAARAAEQTRPPRPEPLPLAGEYTAPHDLDSLRAFSFARYAALSHNDLYFCFANSDLHPSIGLFARAFVENVLSKLALVFERDPRLGALSPPNYSEPLVAEMVARQHDRNVASRKGPPGERSDPAQDIQSIFDGCWLQGFADVSRAGFEEYGWLFRIYASEHGDGDLAWNHSLIFRKAFAELGSDVMLPKTDRRLYDIFDIGYGSLTTLAVALNTRRFMPEILGVNLGIEATGVGGAYIENWKRAEGSGAEWKALAARLHNSIDNYADGHTKWSLAAVQAFMQRVKDGAVGNAELQGQWHRIWRLWRCQDILTLGTETERAALMEHFGLKSLAPT